MKINKEKKTLLGLLGLGTLVTGLAITSTLYFKDPFPKFEEPFNRYEYADYLLKANIIDLNGDRIPDAIVGYYDINKNGIVDVQAFYRIIKYGQNEIITNGYAEFIMVDRNEDGITDYTLLGHGPTIERELMTPPKMEEWLREVKNEI